MDELFNLVKEIDNTDKIIELINTGEYDLNIRDMANNYLLTYAITQNNKKLVNELLINGAKIDIFDSDGRSILYDSIRFGYLDLIKILLDKNVELVGINILNMLDKRGMCPIHYCIQFKNIDILDLFMKYDCNINMTNVIGEYPIHLAISSRYSEMVKKIIEYNADINVYLRSGENSLHLSLNFKLNDISELLIDKGININKKDNQYDYSPLHYSRTLNNKIIFKKLLDQYELLDVNTQDVFGNTVLHYICYELQYDFLDILFKSKIINKLNFNLYSNKKQLPLMVLLSIIKNEDELDYELLKTFIVNTNLNFGGLDGVTSLAYLVSGNRWRQFRDVLKHKKLNIFLKAGVKRIVDYVKSEDIEDFLNLVADSYYNQLISNRKITWKEEWENKCKDKINDEINCKNIILDKLLELYNNKHTELYCNTKTSYPIKKESLTCPLITEYEQIDFCTFAGVNMDIIFGMLYLINRHKNVCCPIQKITFNQNDQQINLVIEWNNNVLQIEEDFLKNFKKCIINKRFVIIPLGIHNVKGDHANYLLYDNKNKEIERFEPFGAYGPQYYNYNRDVLDDNLTRLFKQIKVKYVSPKEYLPKVGFQFFEAQEKNKIGDPAGFCAVWSVWYVDQRLTYNNIRRDKLVKKLIKEISYRNIAYRDLIRNYSSVITKIRDEAFNKVGLDINKWLVDEYTMDHIKELMIEINKLYVQ